MSAHLQVFLRFLMIACVCVAWSTDRAYSQANPLFGGNGLNLSGSNQTASDEPSIKISWNGDKFAKGDEIVVSIQVKTSKSAYVYSQNPNIGAETKITLSEVAGLKPIDTAFIPDKDPKIVPEPLFDNAKLEKFYGGVTWTRRYQVEGNAVPKLTGEVRYQVCDDATCKQFSEPFELAAPASTETEPSGDSPDLAMLLAAESKDKATDETTKPAAQGLASVKIRPEREFGGPDPIEFVVSLEQPKTDNGETIVAVSINATLDGDWHIYAQTQDPEMFGIPTEIKLDKINGLEAIDDRFVPSEAPEIVKVDADIQQEVFHHKVKWTKKFKVVAAEVNGPINGSIKYQLCEADGKCLPPNTVNFTLQGTKAKPKAPVAKVTSNSGDSDAEVTTPIEEASAVFEQGLIPFLLTGIAFGYLALLTPCVFPMIPITVSFFLKQAEKEHHRPVGMALLYCFGIVATFTLIGVVFSALFGASFATSAANNYIFNLFLAAVLIFFGMNMLGLFDIEVPSWILSWSSSKESQGGVIGVLFMAFTFTLVSFTCTFAFVGTLMPLAAQGNYYWPILGMIAFSTAFASPFFFLALFPSYLKKLPKSGGWMNNVKVTFGLLEIGAALKFLSVADINLFGSPYLFDYNFVMAAWMMLCLVTGAYLLGLFKLPHDTPTDTIGVIRLTFAMLFLGFGVYLSAGIYGSKTPEGVLWEQIAAFAPPSFESENSVDLGPVLKHDELLYALDVDKAVDFAQANEQPLFIDFTGANCVNCRAMEKNVFPIKANHDLLKEFVRAQLYTDTIPEMEKGEADKLLEKNRRLQAEWFNSATMPAYAIVTSDGTRILSRYEGAERNRGEFTKFLQTGLTAWEEQVAGQLEPVRR